ncbi:unnamed protein product [Protopolystoma xenopodis]|uniref:Uncharacterized protein n=1 Tax=Protopolystoma xenopodis TaxID=117903 RepID=A0A448X3J6_9PLAT|nr:unnamed protein product [Protopolystoma xenopodis]
MEHKRRLMELEEALRQHGLELRSVSRDEYTYDAVNWADFVFSAGGDGTFLLAASKILQSSKPIVGLNTDPLW